MSANIAIINASTVLKDAEVQAIVPALQKQVVNDFAPVYGMSATLAFFSQSTTPPAGSWWITVLDNSDQAGALGYHDLTNEGLPLAKVFAAGDIQNKASWSVTVSHELLEMLADPDIALTAFAQTDATTGTLYAYEVCDACEDDQYGYQIDGISVSDFVYPAWFESFRKPSSTQFDRQQHITSPLQLLGSGYIGVFSITGGSGWTQKTGQLAAARYSSREGVGSRRERRRIPRHQWLSSKVAFSPARGFFKLTPTF
ncbi:MAG: hypothetical protein WB615_00375 [Candidatus Tumulicola sp.]